MPKLAELATPGAAFTLGEWLVEPAVGAISRDGQQIHLEPKVVEVLAYLAGRAGQVVSKRELIDAVWQVEVISNSRLTRVISDLRRALGDDAGQPRYVKTIPTRGYRLVATVRAVQAPDAIESEKASAFELEVAGRGYSLAEGENTLGRGADVDIRIDSEWVSRLHARIFVDGSTAHIEDLGSKNGTYLRGERLAGRAELHDGDEISVGRGVMTMKFVTVIGSTRTETAIDPTAE